MFVVGLVPECCHQMQILSGLKNFLVYFIQLIFLFRVFGVVIDRIHFFQNLFSYPVYPPLSTPSTPQKPTTPKIRILEQPLFLPLCNLSFFIYHKNRQQPSKKFLGCLLMALDYFSSILDDRQLQTLSYKGALNIYHWPVIIIVSRCLTFGLSTLGLGPPETHL